MSLIFRNFIAIYKPVIAMKNQDKKAQLTPEQEEINRLRNENHNLKRQVKRMKEKEKARKANEKEAAKDLKEEIMDESMEDIKKKLAAAGLKGKELEVAELFMSEVTGTRKR